MKALWSRLLDRWLAPNIDQSIQSWRRARSDMSALRWRRWEKRWVLGG